MNRLLVLAACAGLAACSTLGAASAPGCHGARRAANPYGSILAPAAAPQPAAAVPVAHPGAQCGGRP